jgi:hypothetical protein
VGIEPRRGLPRDRHGCGQATHRGHGPFTFGQGRAAGGRNGRAHRSQNPRFNFLAVKTTRHLPGHTDAYPSTTPLLKNRLKLGNRDETGVGLLSAALCYLPGRFESMQCYNLFPRRPVRAGRQCGAESASAWESGPNLAVLRSPAILCPLMVCVCEAYLGPERPGARIFGKSRLADCKRSETWRRGSGSCFCATFRQSRFGGLDLLRLLAFGEHRGLASRRPLAGRAGAQIWVPRTPFA